MRAAAATCRACGKAGLESVLNLGRTPLANALRTADQLDEPEPTYPLELAFCPACALVQITETAPPAELFYGDLYVSSLSETMVRHARALVEELIAERRLSKRSVVVEIASNDGYLLQHYRDAGVPALGVEPAANHAKIARDRGIRTLCGFFNLDMALKIVEEGHQADVIHAHNVLAHAADLNSFVTGIEQALKPSGLAVIETPYVRDLIDRCAFDTISHENLSYFSLTALDHLFRVHSLTIADVKRVPIHGGSLRLYVVRSGAAKPSKSVRDLLAEEQAWGVDRFDAHGDFAARVKALRDSLCGLLEGLKREGRRIAAYGASVKGSTLLNTFGIGRETLDFVADRSANKQGRYMPGVRVPILPPSALVERMPDYILLLSWNVAEEVIEQQEAYRRGGGRFILPVPEPRIVPPLSDAARAA